MQDIATRYGILKTHEADDLISRCLATYGEWAQYELQFVADNIASQSRIADIGAFLGTFGLGLSQLTKAQSLCFVEANAVTARLLRANVERNASVTSEVVESIVGPFQGALAGTHTAGNMGSFSVVEAEADSDKIASPSVGGVTSLEALTAQHGPFDLYKLDVEGAEKAIFASELDFLQTCKSTFWVECNETTDSLDVADLLIKCGLSVYYFAFPAIAQKPFNQKATNGFPFAYEAGLWATHGSAPTLSDELGAAGCKLEPVTSRESLRSSLWRTPRWAPAEWLALGREEIAAAAVHHLFGETFDEFLTANAQSTEATRTAMTSLNAQLHEKIQGLQTRLVEMEKIHEAERGRLRAADIVLFEERERSAAAITLLKNELGRINAQGHEFEVQLARVLSSSSWRVTMPLRMLLRVLRGDWAEIRRMVRAKSGRN